MRSSLFYTVDKLTDQAKFMSMERDEECDLIVKFLREMRIEHRKIVQTYPQASVAKHEEFIKIHHIKFIADMIEQRKHRNTSND